MKGVIRVPPSGTILPTGLRGRSRNPVMRPCTGLGIGCLWSWATQDMLWGAANQGVLHLAGSCPGLTRHLESAARAHW